MDIFYTNKRIQRLCTSSKYMVRQLGPRNAEKLKRRLSEIRAADNIGVLQKLPQARCHELKGNRKGQFAVDLDHPYRLIFTPANNPIPKKEDGGYGVWKIDAIIIQEVTDYHG